VVAELGEPGNQPLNTQPFFRSKRAAAVFKHAILGGYVVPFASKTGSASVGNRVVIVDGYAGAGRYDSGESGPPSLIAAAARSLTGRSLECFFVEKDRRPFERLCDVLAEEDRDEVMWTAWQGTVEQHLDE
jgi:three-Cys-motif partner protein